MSKIDLQVADSLEFEELSEPETDIQQPKGVREVEVYAHREVDEDGVVEVKEVRNRTNSRGEVVHGTPSKALKGRQTGESQDDYDDDKYADEPDFKKRPGSSIGWDPDADGLGGQ